MTKETSEILIQLAIKTSSRLTTGKHLENLWHICEQQKSVSTKRLNYLLESVSDQMKRDSQVIRAVIDQLHKPSNNNSERSNNAKH